MHMSAGRVLSAIATGLLGLVALALVAAGTALLVADHARDEEGFLTGPTRTYTSAGYAVTFEDLELDVGRPGRDVLEVFDVQLRVTARPADGRPLFLGVAGEDAARAYLGDVHRDVVVDAGREHPSTTTVPGGAPAAPPGDLDLWVASTQGTGPLELTWTPQSGSWVVVAMNADATAGVAFTAAPGFAADVLTPVGIALLVTGLVLAVATVGLALAIARPGGPPPPAAPAGGGGRPTRHPVRVEAQLDQPLNRFLWLVKWIAVLPHMVVLAFLWVAFVLTTPVAGIAILFTGRYPRSLFDFNVGVLRWTWRVSYYATSAFGTDAYPPFTLADVDYPARLDVAHPDRLSRGLVLVKWWLLVIPHALVVAVLTGPAWSVGDDARFALGGGLIGLLAVIAGVVLLLTGSYPQALFDLLIGLNRWVYRTIAYAALMTDVYPPFRLDQGGLEPPPAVPAAPAPPVPPPPGGHRPAPPQWAAPPR